MDIALQNLTVTIQAFHFLRPEWLAALLPVVWGWWRIRSQSGAMAPWANHIAPHLLKALTVNPQQSGRFRSIDLIALLLASLTFAAAGPAWNRIPNPFVSETAPLVVALDTSELMYATDVQPSRLERAKMKIRDLVHLRAGARTALIAYAGTAHMVLPPSEDADLIQPFLDGLVPEIMPKKGHDAAAALILALEVLRTQETPGSVVFVTGGFEHKDLSAFRRHFSGRPAAGIAALIVGTDAGGPVTRPDGSSVTGPGGQRVNSAIDKGMLDLMRAAGVSIVRAELGDGDIKTVERRVASNLQSVLNAASDAEFEDMGWVFVWPAALLCLFWFRRGWSFRMAMVLFAVSLGVADPGGASAQDGASRASRAHQESEVREGSVKQVVLDWFFTRDQQGRYAFENKEFSKAGDLFADPMWKGVALYEAGRYVEAAAVFAEVPSAWGLFNRGNALIRARDYATAVVVFEQALKEDPDNAAIRRNLETAREILAYLEEVRAQSDRGVGADVDGGADDVVFDKQSQGGFDFVVSDQERLEIQSTEKWMRAVDTRSADFLRTKFALEASQIAGSGREE